MLKKRFIAALCAVSVLTGSVYAANILDFSDVNGHWAYDALSNAVDDGYLNGSDGKLNPNSSLTTAQMAVILNRVLHTSDTSRVYPNMSQSEWYSNDANMAVSAGFLPVDGSLNINNNITRAEVFKALVNAFGLAEADPSIESVKKFNDWTQMTLDQRRAAAILIDKGILNGSDNGGLNPNNSISRAEFMTLIYRILDSDLIKIFAPWSLYDETIEYSEQVINENDMADESNTIQTNPDTSISSDTTSQIEKQPDEYVELEYSENNQNYSIWDNIMLIDMPLNILDENRAYDKIILSGKAPEIENSDKKINIGRLVLNNTGSDIKLDENSILKGETIVIGSGNGTVTLEGDLTKKVEITGSGRTINLNGVNLESLIISGNSNNILIDENTQIDNLIIQVAATNNVISLNGIINNANINGNYSKIYGSGISRNVNVKGSYCNINVVYDTFDDSGVDTGLDNVKLSLNTPKVAPGGDLVATVTITGVDKPKTVSAQWYYEGSADAAFGNSAMQMIEGKTSTYSKDITFEKYMKLWQNVKFVITYKNTVTEQIETLAITGDVQIENYPASHYLPDASEVLAKVHPYYYSSNTDYTKDEKTVFVNAKGYSSKTQYLIWVSRSAQMVNVFEGSKWNWELIHEFQCATGKASSPTPIGVTEVTYKQTGWFTSSYTCRPVVRFYPGTGYAFHSRLYYPGSNKLKDPSIGFPVSAGCVRMLDEGIYWLYNNIPSGTTVVIY